MLRSAVSTCHFFASGKNVTFSLDLLFVCCQLTLRVWALAHRSSSSLRNNLSSSLLRTDAEGGVAASAELLFEMRDPGDGSAELNRGRGIFRRLGSPESLRSPSEVADTAKRRSSMLHHKRRDSAISEVGGLFARQQADERQLMCDVLEKMTHAADLAWHRRNAVLTESTFYLNRESTSLVMDSIPLVEIKAVELSYRHSSSAGSGMDHFHLRSQLSSGRKSSSLLSSSSNVTATTAAAHEPQPPGAAASRCAPVGKMACCVAGAARCCACCREPLASPRQDNQLSADKAASSALDPGEACAPTLHTGQAPLPCGSSSSGTGQDVAQAAQVDDGAGSLAGEGRKSESAVSDSPRQDEPARVPSTPLAGSARGVAPRVGAAGEEARGRSGRSLLRTYSSFGRRLAF